ncbi:shugoshin 2-like isoform X2 [Sceloporus undulatus]|nr:shugoshin 2-like isoform X2 [Sceloporus undulatus]XP_042323787.1 shugoshin 2-like isoform X2 [Sceloporus undulatus]
MSVWGLAETSTLFSVNGVREHMKEKKNGVLKTAKQNAFLASKIKAKTINNSSIIKVTLKQNNKALALALNAAKIAAQRLTEEKMLLQKEVELCHFENACLRQKLSSVTKCIEELQHFMTARLQAASKLLSSPQNGSCSLLLNDAEHRGTDNIAANQDDDHCSSLAAPKAMRIPLSHVDDEDSENGRNMRIGTYTGLQILPLGIPTSGSAESQKSVPTSAVEKSSSSYIGLAANENDGRKLSEVDDTASTFNLKEIFGDNLSSSAQSSRSCSLSALSKNSPMQQSKNTRPWSDGVVSLHGHITKRKKPTTVSTVFDSNSQMEPLDNVLNDGLQGTKEGEASAKECLEVSQIGELVSLKNKNKSSGKKEAKALNKASMNAKNRDVSRRKSKTIFNDYDNDDAVVSDSNTLSSNSKLDRPGAASQLPVPLARFSQKKECSSKHADKTTDCRTPSVVDLTSSKRTFLEKMKNLESQFQDPETIPSDKTQRDEKSHGCEVRRLSQYSNKTRSCRRTYVVVPEDMNHMNDCAPSAHKIRKNKYLENEEDLASLFPSTESGSCNSKAPFHSFGTQPLVDLQKEIVSQEEITLDLNVRRLKPKRKTQKIDGAHVLSETEVQSLDVDLQFHTQPEESKIKKGNKGKAGKAAKGNTEEEHCRTKVDEFNLSEKSPSVIRRTSKDRRALKQADTTNLFSLGNMAPVLPLSSDGEDAPLDNIFRSSTKIIQKVQESAVIQNSSVTNTNSNSLEKACLGSNSNLNDGKKKLFSMPKLSKRATYTVRDVTELCVASDLSLQSPGECQNSQVDRARWSFLQVSSSRTQQDSEAPPLFDSLTKGNNIPDSSSKGTSKIMLRDACSPVSSHSVLPTAKDQTSPVRYSALPKDSADFNKNYSTQMPSGRHKKKTTQASLEAPLQNTALQENENKVLKDLSNVNSGPCSSILSEASPAPSTRRRKKEVSYAEPKLNSKLRRGDPFTVTDFLSSPVYKSKNKKSAKTSGRTKKTKKMKAEDTKLSLDFMANQ